MTVLTIVSIFSGVVAVGALAFIPHRFIRQLFEETADHDGLDMRCLEGDLTAYVSALNERGPDPVAEPVNYPRDYSA